jgi:hypothetical protein
MINYFIKESPLKGLLGLGGGIGSFLTKPSAGGGSGGDTTECEGQTIHTYTESGTFEVKGELVCTVLCCGGGGGGYYAGGGGAPVSIATRTVPAGTYTMLIGAGGARNTDGSSTTAFNGTSLQVLNNGGTKMPGSSSPGNASAYGFYGGNTPASINSDAENYPTTNNTGGIPTFNMATYYRSAAGSGANSGSLGSVGGCGPGGAGIQSNIDCNDYYYGGGGGGGLFVYTGPAGAGGLGGGGGGSGTPGPAGASTGGAGDTNGMNPGGNGGNNIPAGAGGANTGGGGGGGGGAGGAAGGSGVIIISYPTP